MTVLRRVKTSNTVGLLVLLVILPLAVGGCIRPGDWVYLGRLGYSQLQMSLHSQPLQAALSDESTLDREQKEKLRLVLEVKGFCEQLGLNTRKVYDDYSTAEGKEFYIVAASDRLRFHQYLWNWPIAGPLPYKGFFNEGSARKEGQSLAKQGLDVFVGRAAGYSTLGWFNDPLLPVMLNLDEVALTQLVIHEAVHRNIFEKGFPSFNEGAATFIAREGSALFVEERFGVQSPEYRRIVARHESNDEITRQVQLLYHQLDAIYSSSLSIEEKLARRQEAIAAVAPSLSQRVHHDDLNNAWILLQRVYTEYLGELRQLHTALGKDLTQTIQLLKKVAGTPVSPKGALEAELRRLESRRQE